MGNIMVIMEPIEELNNSLASSFPKQDKESGQPQELSRASKERISTSYAPPAPEPARKVPKTGCSGSSVSISIGSETARARRRSISSSSVVRQPWALRGARSAAGRSRFCFAGFGRGAVVVFAMPGFLPQVATGVAGEGEFSLRIVLAGLPALPLAGTSSGDESPGYGGSAG